MKSSAYRMGKHIGRRGRSSVRALIARFPIVLLLVRNVGVRRGQTWRSYRSSIALSATLASRGERTPPTQLTTLYRSSGVIAGCRSGWSLRQPHVLEDVLGRELTSDEEERLNEI